MNHTQTTGGTLGRSVSDAKLSSSLAPESEVDSQISRLVDKVELLSSRLGQLGLRLEPVLTPYASSTGGEGDGIEQTLSPVASRVRGIGYSVESLTARVDALLYSLAV